MSNFCKVFQVKPDEQVLCTIGYDDEEEEHFMSLETDFPEFHVGVKFSSGNEEKIRIDFEQFDFMKALDWRHKMEENMTVFREEKSQLSGNIQTDFET